MLPYKNRLIKKEDFLKVYKKGRTISFKEKKVTIRFVKNSKKNTRIGFVVGKEYSMKAVQRNQIKRALREIFRKYAKVIRPGIDMVVTCKKKGKKGRNRQTNQKGTN